MRTCVQCRAAAAQLLAQQRLCKRHTIVRVGIVAVTALCAPAAPRQGRPTPSTPKAQCEVRAWGQPAAAHLVAAATVRTVGALQRLQVALPWWLLPAARRRPHGGGRATGPTPWLVGLSGLWQPVRHARSHLGCAASSSGETRSARTPYTVHTFASDGVLWSPRSITFSGGNSARTSGSARP